MINELEVIQPIINWNKIKYSVFNKLIIKSPMEGNKVNFFINLDSILELFYTDKMIPAIHSLKHLENIVLTAEIINIIAHYRHFFWKNYRVPTKFYIYTCNKVPKLSKKINKDYMKKFIEKHMEDDLKYGEANKIINVNKNLLELLSMYVQDAYYLESNGLEPSIIPYKIINKYKNEKDVCNIVMSSDKYDYQLVNLYNTFILRPRGDKSKLIDKDNILDYKFKDIKYRPKEEITSKLFSSILAFDGLKKRNIEKVKGYSFVKSMKLLEKMISNGDINRFIKNPDKYLFDNYKLSDDQIEQFINNFKCIDLKYIDKLIDDDLFNSKVKLINRYNNSAIMSLNSEYFSQNNIQLIELCEGIGVWKNDKNM